MNFYIFWLLLLLVLSTYPESPQHVKPVDSFDSSVVTVYYSNLPSLSFLAPVLPQKVLLPQNEVMLPQNEVAKITLPQNEVMLPQNKVILGQIKCLKSEILFKRVQNILSMLNLVMTQSVKIFRKLMLPIMHGGKAFLWAIRIAPECFQNVLKMYVLLLAENQVSI